MTVEILADVDAVARHAAEVLAAAARAAVDARGRFVVGISGGRTPWLMLRALNARDDVPWPHVHIVQVDERVAPEAHPDRNLTHLGKSLLDGAAAGAAHVHAMPVESPDLEDAAQRYARTLEQVAGTPAILDLVHLGLGADGHTASLVPGDPVLAVDGTDVAATGLYQGRRRMTLTYPVINRARRVLWLITGADKAPMLARLRAGDNGIPAGRVRQDNAVVLTDRAAAG